MAASEHFYQNPLKLSFFDYCTIRLCFEGVFRFLYLEGFWTKNKFTY